MCIRDSNTMYAHVYTCTHCRRKSHLAKFCYDRIHDLNLANKFVWVGEGTNPHGPKKIWVPKTIPLVYDVGVGSRMTWEYRYLGVDTFRTSCGLFGCITFKRCLVGRPPCFGDMESCLIDFGNNPLLSFILCMLFMFIVLACFDVLLFIIPMPCLLD